MAGGQRASRAMRTADSHARKIRGNCGRRRECRLHPDCGRRRRARDGSRAPAFYQHRARPGNQRLRRLAHSRRGRHVAAGQDTHFQRKFGVTTVANRSITSRIIVIASGSRMTSPLAATIAGSTTTIRDLANADSIPGGAYYLGSGEHPGFRGCDREVICDRI